MPKLNVDVGVDGTRLVRGLKQTEGAVKQWSNSVSGYIASAFSVTAIYSMMSKTAGYFDNIGNAAERLDVGVEAMQTLVMMAKMAGRELSNVESMMTAISEAQITAIQDPSSKQAEAFSKLGLSPQMLNQMPTQNLIQGLASQTQGMGRAGVSANLGDILGSPKNVNTFTAMIDDLANLQEKISQFKGQGVVLGEGEVKTMKIAMDEWELRWQQFTAVVTKYALPALRIVARGLEAAFLFIKAATGGFFAALGRLTSGVNKGKGLKGLWNDITESWDLYAKAWMDASDAYEKSGKALDDIRNQQSEQNTGPGISVGTGKKDNPTESKPADKIDFMKGFQKYEPKMSEIVGQYSMPMSNFLGNNMMGMQSVSQQSLSELQKIQKNTKELAVRMGMQTAQDIMATLFGL